MQSFNRVALAAGLMCASAVAHAGVITFSFTGVSSGGTLTTVAGAGGPDTALMVFNQNIPLNFTIDDTANGGGLTTFNNARATMSISLPPANNLGGGLFHSQVSGSFAIYDFTGNVRTDILTANLTGGIFQKFQTSHLIQLGTNTGLTYTAGPRLTQILGPGRQLAASESGLFALADVRTFTGGTEVIGPGNVFESFFANTAFTGSSNVIPNPGSVALLTVGGLMMARRRRK